MAIPNTTGMQRKPTHPGEMLREDFLPDNAPQQSVDLFPDPSGCF